MESTLSKPIVTFTAQYADGEIRGAFEPAQLAEIIATGRVVILQSVFNSTEILAMRRKVFEWAQTQPENNADNENFHCIQQGISLRQKTPHAYHAYNLDQVYQLSTTLDCPFLVAFFEALRKFQNQLNGIQQDSLVAHNEEGYRFHPQLIQYPVGLGHFGRHIHPLEPQKVGTIVSLSQRGQDYQQGGTCFETPFGTVDIEGQHNTGDIAFFRFDLPHWVKPIDAGIAGNWSREDGRWVAALPYYPQASR